MYKVRSKSLSRLSLLAVFTDDTDKSSIGKNFAAGSYLLLAPWYSPLI